MALFAVLLAPQCLLLLLLRYPYEIPYNPLPMAMPHYNFVRSVCGCIS
jgi:hypothetical protein